MYFNRLEIETALTKNEIIDRLNGLTYTSKLPFFKSNFTDKIFHGQISSDSFQISQVIKGRNSFVPFIQGEILGEGQNKIVLKMRLHFIVILFIVFLTTLIIWSQIKDFYIGGCIFLVFLYGLTIYSYIVECKKVGQIFTDNFEIENKKANA